MARESPRKATTSENGFSFNRLLLMAYGLLFRRELSLSARRNQRLAR